jgi:uncharacterized secreted protein with C-terminal beta-propeller domain
MARFHRRRRDARSGGAECALRCEHLEQRFALSVSWFRGVWTIAGDSTPARVDDTIVIERNPANPRQLRAVVNGTVVGSRLENTVASLRVFGGRGDDSITVSIPGNTRIRTVLDGGSGNDTILGGDGNDVVYGRDGIDSLNGGRGDDTVYGGNGNDSLVGGTGNDRLYGEAGVDTLRGGKGRNLLDGGTGNDVFFGTQGVDTARLSAGETLIGNETTNPLRGLADMEQLKSWYIDTALAEWGDRLGKEAEWWRRCGTVMFDTRGGGVAMTSAGSQSTPVSGTNNQVAGVDEADMVKTDGEHLFVLAGDGVDVVAAGLAGEVGVVSHVTTPGWERALFLSGTLLTVISQENTWGPVASEAAVADARLAWWNQRWQPSVHVTVIDVSNAATPTTVETTRLDGWLVDARAIEGRVLVVTQSQFEIPAPALIPIPGTGGPSSGTSSGEPAFVSPALLPGPAPRVPWIDGGDGTRYVYEDAAAYRARLEQAWATTSIPGFNATLAGSGTTAGDLVVPGHAYLPVEPTSNNMLSVASFEVGDDHAGPDAVTSVAGVSGGVYASTSSLYVSASHYGSWWDVTDTGAATNIYKFDLQNADVPLVAMGAVPGLTLNQFSLDEADDGLLRVATTSGFGDAASSGVYVLMAAAGNLQTVGSVTGLAPGERIFSVRFLGDRGYVSTFRQVDPLFVIDLANPTRPRVVGELKVPGFSSYLHPLDATRLLGIGRDVDPATGLVLGLQLSVFDTSDAANPRRVATYTFPGDGWQSWSDALWDHKAVSWFADQQILALPVSQGDGWRVGSGLVVFRIDAAAADAFTNLGTIMHDGSVRRSLRIGDHLYSVSAGEVKVHRLADPTVEVGSTKLTEYTAEPWFVV